MYSKVSVNGTYFSSSFLAIELFVYTKAVDLSVLILFCNLTKFPYEFHCLYRIFISFYIESLSANKDNLTSSLLIYMSLIYFWCMMALVKISRITLNTCGESDILLLFWILMEMLPSSSHQSNASTSTQQYRDFPSATETAHWAKFIHSAQILYH